jgi:hypothetical protein
MAMAGWLKHQCKASFPRFISIECRALGVV